MTDDYSYYRATGRMAESTQEPIITERLLLRQIQPSDAEAVFAFMSLPSVMQYT
jgi:ribosomal-protein-alanine N-acetyltransferase